ncbi:hypothetical protein [Pseudactinotalea sp.]|uniref:hypothetical protein n=1 Tax=Pseudactinotalea sp. TaxID=1926260 RepID=UPI003B3BE79A
MTQNPPEDQNPGGEQPEQSGGFPPPNQPPAAQPPSYGSPQQPPADQPPGYGTPPPPPGGGTPPPPPAGPGGGFPSAPPPPPGQYGQYGAPQYGGPAGAPGAFGAGQPVFSVGGAIGYGWNSFKSHVGGFLGWSVIVLLVSALLSSLLNPSVNVDFNDIEALTAAATPSIGEQFLGALSSIAAMLLAVIIQQGAVHKVNGRLNGFGDFIKFDHAGPGFLTALLVAAAYIVNLIPFIGWLLALAIFLLGMFAVPIALDTGASPVDAFKRSMQLVTGNVGNVLLLILASIGVMLLGLIALCLGVFVAYPIVLIAGVFAYRTLSGQQVAPA